MGEAQLGAPGEAAQCLCSLQTQGVLLGLYGFFWRSLLVWDESPSPWGRFSGSVHCTDTSPPVDAQASLWDDEQTRRY